MDWLETSSTMESREVDYCMLNIRGTIDVQNESQESVGNLATG